MSKEHIRNLNNLSQEELKKKLGQLPEQELRELHKQSIDSGDYSLQILICYALLDYEDRQSLALDEIKRLKRVLNDSDHKALMLKF